MPYLSPECTEHINDGEDVAMVFDVVDHRLLYAKLIALEVIPQVKGWS